MVGADLGAPAAVCALCLVHAGDWDTDCLAAGDDRLQEDVVVGLFNIAVEQLHPALIFQGKGEAGRHQGLAGASLAAGN